MVKLRVILSFSKGDHLLRCDGQRAKIEGLTDIDLLYTEAERLSRQQGAGEDAPVTYNIKSVTERLGIRPASVRQAYEQLEALGGVHILARQFPRRREQQMSLPLHDTGTIESS